MIRTLFSKFFCIKQMYPFWRIISEISLNCMGLGTGDIVAESGEKNVIAYLKKNILDDNIVLFDCGANIGDYTNELVEMFPDASIHSFEPLDITYNILVKNVKSKSVKLNKIGLSNRTGDDAIYYNENNLGLTSLFDRQLDYHSLSLPSSNTIKLITIDEYCKLNNINNIDFLKMDIEGGEYNALLGATNMLKNSKIKVIQIEFGGCQIDARVFFRDYWNLLNEQYYVYRIVSNGLIKIKKYEEILEIYLTCNYLFINKSL